MATSSSVGSPSDVIISSPEDYVLIPSLLEGEGARELFVNVFLPILQREINKPAKTVCDYTERVGILTAQHIESLDRAHALAQNLYVLSTLRKVSKSFYALYQQERTKMGEAIVSLVSPIHNEEQGPKIMRECVDNGWYLSALKIYFFYCPQALENRASDPMHHDGLQRTILHSAIAPHTMRAYSCGFVGRLMNIHQEPKLGLLERGIEVKEIQFANLFQQKDSEGFEPLHSMMDSYWDKPSNLRAVQYSHLFRSFKQGANPNSLSTMTEAQNIQAPPLYFFLCQALGNNLQEYKDLTIKNVIRRFVENGADLNRQNENGDTILHLLAKHYSRHREPNAYHFSAKDKDMCTIISYFVEHGADLNRQNKDGNTILHLLAGQFEVLLKEQSPIVLLLKHNANIELMNTQGDTFLDTLGRFYVSRPEDSLHFLTILEEVKNSFAVMRFAESKFARNRIENSPQKSFVWVMFKDGIDWAIKDQEENTYLHYLVMHRSGEEIKDYCYRRSPPLYQEQMNTQNNKGLTPYELAKKLNKPSQKTFEDISRKDAVEKARREELDRMFRNPRRAPLLGRTSPMLSSFASRMQKLCSVVVQLFKAMKKFFVKLARSYM